MMEDVLVNELKRGFRVDHCVDIFKATSVLATAISEELKPITESRINAIWQSVIKPEDSAFVVDNDGRTLFGIPLLCKRYSEFFSAVGDDLGIELGDDDIMCDDWITESMPKTRTIASALMEIFVDYLAEASANIMAKGGATPAEVFVKSINTGESYEQSRTRLTYAGRGLQVVKPKDK